MYFYSSILVSKNYKDCNIHYLCFGNTEVFNYNVKDIHATCDHLKLLYTLCTFCTSETYHELQTM